MLLFHSPKFEFNLKFTVHNDAKKVEYMIRNFMSFEKNMYIGLKKNTISCVL